MASQTPTMALSTKQAQAVCKELGVALPRKNNGWRKVGNVRICRLSLNFRKSRRNAQAYRLTAPTPEELSRFFGVANANGRSVCIVYQTPSEDAQRLSRG